MPDVAQRPDPDHLLRRLQAEQVRARAGRLEVFFGYAPGVGKTYRMLQAAHALQTGEGRDVVVGVVESHGRPETEALLEGLERLPKRALQYRGRTYEELDVDAALQRRPGLLLVDELAHTNVPGVRHAKRWRDVVELLDAGVDVMTTLNVQHLDSLHDIIAQITGIQVRETVPDSVLDRADSVVLCDLPPEALLQRLREGKVYLPAQAGRAAAHFFQRGNLLGLRELALRRTAQRVDADVEQWREDHGVARIWPASERILVCVGPRAADAQLVRAGARMAAGLRCPWSAAWVDAPAWTAMADADRQRLEGHLRLAESLGARVVRLEGASVATALLDHARRYNVTRLIIGKPTRSRLRDRLLGSVLDDLVRKSGDIEVHVIRGDAESPGRSRLAALAAPWQASLGAHGRAAALCAATLAIAWPAHFLLNLPDPEMLFLIAVMVAASWLGRGPGLTASALGVAAYDFFFVEPLHTFSVADQAHVLTFAMMFGVGLVLSELTGRIREQQREAAAREARTATLYDLTRELAASADGESLALCAARRAVDAFEGKAVVLRHGPQRQLERSVAHPPDFTLDPSELALARWSCDHGELAGLGTETVPGARVWLAPLRAGATTVGVLALAPRDGRPLSAEQRALLQAFSRQVALAVERTSLAVEAQQAADRARAEEVRSSLLSAVSHDLRTPLASITGLASTLRDQPELPREQRLELLTAVCEQAERLERQIANLLDMTRLESGSVQLQRELLPLSEVVGATMQHMEVALRGRSVSVDVPEDLPWLRVDPVLLEQLFVNLLENAVKYTPAEAKIAVQARRVAGEGPALPGAVEVTVRDHGPGLPPGQESSLFEKFSRGAQGSKGGVGLGLAICRGIAEVHGGAIRAESAAGGGAAFIVRLPIVDEAATLTAEGADG